MEFHEVDATPFQQVSRLTRLLLASGRALGGIPGRGPQEAGTTCETSDRGTGWRAGRTATRRSKRPVAPYDTVVASLREHRKRQREERRQAGPLWLGHEHSAAPDAFVFTTSLGTPLDESNVRRSYQRLLKKAGLPHRRFHDYADLRVMPTWHLPELVWR